jgi:hypothetical protein
VLDYPSPCPPIPLVEDQLLSHPPRGVTQCSRTLRFPHQNPVCSSSLPHACQMPIPFHSWFDNPNNM